MKTYFSLILLLPALLLGSCKGQQKTDGDAAASDTIPLSQVKFNADSAFAHIVKQCEFGPRVPNSEAHQRCGDYIVSAFRRLGLQVTEQKADLKALDGKTLAMRNIVASYLHEQTERVIICAHWESRPWADADPDSSKHRQPVMAANDGASGVGVMLELARLLPQLNPAVGIDFICFDAEDYGTPYWDAALEPEDGSDWCMGSRYWSRNPHVAGYRARYGILLDMVGGEDARFCFEGISMRYARDVMVRLWDAASRCGHSDLFQSREGGWAQDDHVPMNEVAGIPTIDVIPFVEGDHTFGATWHTVSDTPERISKTTLKGVGQSLIQFLSEEQ